MGLSLIRQKYTKMQEIELSDDWGFVRLSEPIGFDAL